MTKAKRDSNKNSDLTAEQRKLMYAVSGKTGVDPRTARAYLIGEPTSHVSRFAVESALRELGREDLIRKDVTT